MFLVTATVPAGSLSGGTDLDQRIRDLASPEDQLEHVHVAAAPDGGTRLALFLGHPDGARTEAAAVRLLARALPPAAGASVDWTPATSLLSAMERLGAGAHDKELPSQEADTQ
ncbi:hypothetical protein ACPEIF_02220 [Streptomyces sp. NPDC012600]|uniref:Uncharacterized protein n=2 Tax=Streptomycetaceae TaxID=2062 RepID=A0ABU2W7R1_9ACTN|nr:hypothetical protein [Streptomyces griseus]ARF74974.1 hypothetical protein B7C62_24110 [Kitasatospora albolonga]MDT0493907.1 hypothetical protein [Streptomyces griseus]